MTRESILQALPPYQNKKVLIKKRQTVGDIMQETLNAHDYFSTDYDLIADRFCRKDDVDTLKEIFNFLKLNVSYKEESERNQVTMSPAAILEKGVVDCKCYSLFIGGVLDALNRQGGNFDWCYCYASYTAGVRTPGHVFVSCTIDGKEFWIDPVLSSFDKRTPVPKYIIKKKKISDMLYRLSGINKNVPAPLQVQQSDYLQSVGNGATGINKISGVGDWIRENPKTALALGVGAVLVIIYLRKKKR